MSITRVPWWQVQCQGPPSGAVRRRTNCQPSEGIYWTSNPFGTPTSVSLTTSETRIWEACGIPIVYVSAYAGEPTLIQTNTSTPVLPFRMSFDAVQLQTILAQALAAHR